MKTKNNQIKLLIKLTINWFSFYDFSTLNGFIDLKYLTKKIVSQNYELEDTVEQAVFQKFYRVKEDTILGLVSRLLETEGFVAVVDSADHVTGIINHLQLLNFISKSGRNTENF